MCSLGKNVSFNKKDSSKENKMSMYVPAEDTCHCKFCTFLVKMCGWGNVWCKRHSEYLSYMVHSVDRNWSSGQLRTMRNAVNQRWKSANRLIYSWVVGEGKTKGDKGFCTQFSRPKSIFYFLVYSRFCLDQKLFVCFPCPQDVSVGRDKTTRSYT